MHSHAPNDYDQIYYYFKLNTQISAITYNKSEQKVVLYNIDK